MNSDILFILGDGDNIRHRIEAYLFDNHLQELSNFSEALIKAIAKLKEAVIRSLDATFIFAGGDDIFFHIDEKRYDKHQIEQLIHDFYSDTGCTISFGVGKDVKAAYLNLMKAKATGKAKVIDT